MKFELIIKPEKLIMYGNMPCLPEIIKDGCGKRYVGEESDSWLLLEDFVPAIDKIFDNLLDYGDVDYFDTNKCKMLKEWLDARMKANPTGRLKKLYEVLLEYTLSAIELGTGVVIEL